MWNDENIDPGNEIISELDTLGLLGGILNICNNDAISCQLWDLDSDQELVCTKSDVRNQKADNNGAEN